MKRNSSSHKESQIRPLRSKNVQTVLCQHIAEQFDFSPQSIILKQIVAQAQRVFYKWHVDHHEQRLIPHHLLVEYKCHSFVVPMMDEKTFSARINSEPWPRVFSRIYEDLFRQIIAVDSSATLDDARALICPASLYVNVRQKSKEKDNLSWVPSEDAIDFSRLNTLLRIPGTLRPLALEPLDVPKEILDILVPNIIQEGRSKSSAEIMVKYLLQLWRQICPMISTLQPGQCSALVLDVHDYNMRTPTELRRHIPVILSIYTPPELESIRKFDRLDRDFIDDILAMKTARILAESYSQGGLITFTHIAFLLQISPEKVSQLVNRFESRHQIILPSPGSIHDMGSKFTHKALIVNLHLSGFNAKEIAHKTYHSPEAVSSYIRSFETVLLLISHKLPRNMFSIIMRLSSRVIEQYVDLIEKFIGDDNAVHEYVNKNILTGAQDGQNYEVSA